MLDWIRKFVDLRLSEFWEVTRTKGEGSKSYARMSSSPTNIVVAHFAEPAPSVQGNGRSRDTFEQNFDDLNATEQT